MRKLLKFLFILFLGVICCACVNTVAVHELNQKAAKYLDDGNIEAAISRLEASIDLDSNIYESRYNLASAYMMTNSCDKALEHILAAKELNKNEPIAYYTHGVVAMCIANKIQNNEKINLPEGLNVTYESLLNDANESFDKYATLAPGASDVQDVLNLIQDNKAKLQNADIEN